MAKIFSILTLIAAALALYLGLESSKRVKDLKTAGDTINGKLTAAQTDLTRTKATLTTAQEELATNKQELESSRAKQATAEQESAKAKADFTAANTELEKAKGELAKINDDIKKFFPGQDIATGFEGITAKITELSAKATASEAKVADLEKKLAETNSEKEQMMAREKELSDQIANRERTIKRYTDNIMEKGIRGRVMAVNSGWGFAVLSVGDRQGAAANKVMIVARNGQAIGKVRITNVEATQSVADILPGTFVRGTTVQPGDSVIYTGDNKVQPEEAAPETPAPSTPNTPPANANPATSAPSLPQ